MTEAHRHDEHVVRFLEGEENSTALLQESEDHASHDGPERNNYDATVAGAATALGASTVFFPCLVRLASPRTLASALGLSAGVMIFVSLTEIFTTGIDSFMNAGHDHEMAYVYTTLCFFGGVASMILVDAAVKCIGRISKHGGVIGHKHGGPPHHHRGNECDEPGCEVLEDEEILTPHCMACSRDPRSELEEWQQRAQEEIVERQRLVAGGEEPSIATATLDSHEEGFLSCADIEDCKDNWQTGFVHPHHDDMALSVLSEEEGDGNDSDSFMIHHKKKILEHDDRGFDPSAPPAENSHAAVTAGNQLGDNGDQWNEDELLAPNSKTTDVDEEEKQLPPKSDCERHHHGHRKHHHHEHRDNDGVAETQIIHEQTSSSHQNKKRLLRTGFSAGFAIALHNFPEGLATYVGGMDNPSTGAVLAIAIGLHNIPEGLCVALPIYYATGSRWRGFLWGMISGLSEPVAAALGWAVLANSFSDNLYGSLFGFVSGMMVIISLKELLPTAHRYDPEDTVVTNSLIVGLVGMATSLILFEISGGHEHGSGDDSMEEDHVHF